MVHLLTLIFLNAIVDKVLELKGMNEMLMDLKKSQIIIDPYDYYDMF